jgi:PAS domain S-box-containing protein
MAGGPDLSRLLRAAGDLDSLLSAVARAISETVGFRTVAVSLYRPAWHDLVVTHVHGSEAARATVLGTARDWSGWCDLLDDRFERRGAFLVPNEGLDAAVAADTAAEWHPGDALFVPLRGSDGELVGIVSVDEPESGLRPSDDSLATLVALAEHAAGAIDSAQKEERAGRHGRALEHLMRVSSELAGGRSTDEILKLVCEGIAEALDFGLVVIELADDAQDRYVPVAGAGVDVAEVDLQLPVPIEVLDRFFDPELELEGCYLAGREDALARVQTQPDSFVSTTNGRGPHAWNRHWLLVPLRDRLGERIGFIWADDPGDRLLPSRERLQALRLFADQAAAALESARLYDAAQRQLEDRRQAETSLRKSQELYRRVVEHSTDLIFLLDLGGRFLYASPSTTAVLGYEPSEVVGRRVDELAHPDDLATVQESIATALSSRAQPATARVRHKDGGYLVFEGVPVALDGEDGTPEMILAITRDVTDRRRAEEERRSLEDQLRQAQKMEAVGRLAGGIAHDFNNLLTAIGGYGQLALGSLPGSESRVRRHLEEMLRAAERAAALTRQLLAFSRKQVLQPRLLDVNEVVRGLESMLARLLGSDVELVTSLAPDLGQTHADPSQLEQVVVNLAVNARAALPRGGRLLIETANAELDDETASRHVGSSPGSYVALTVADDGNGMDAETVARAFEPFFTTKGPGEGTGLGLSTVYGIVKQSQGHVVVDSAPGRGTAVTVYLPRAARLSDAARRSGPASGAALDGRGTESILLVEDEEIVRSLVEEMLAGLGYTVEVACDGEEALERIAAGTPADLVISDLVMPRLSGRELAQRLDELRPGTPVLFISGYTGDTTAIHGPLPQGTAFLEKPFSGAELAGKVRAVLDAAARDGRARPAA